MQRTSPVHNKFRILCVRIGKRCFNEMSAALSLIMFTVPKSMIRVWSEIYHFSTWKHYFLSCLFPFTMCLGTSSPVTRIHIHLTATRKLISSPCYLSRRGSNWSEAIQLTSLKVEILMFRSNGFSPLTTEGSRGTDLAILPNFVLMWWWVLLHY